MNDDMPYDGSPRSTTERSFTRRSRREPGVQIVIGLIVVALGVLFTLDNLHLVHARAVLRYWPLALVAVGAVQFVEARTPGRRVAGVMWMLLGAVLLANRLGWVSIRLWALWPLLLVFVGARIFFRAVGRSDLQELSPTADPAVSMIAVLGGSQRRVVSSAFQRAEVTAFMGGGKLDLRDATMAPGGAVVDVFAVMGGFEVLIPPTWSVDTDVTPIMGGCDDKTQPPASSSAPRLKIRGFAMMGGIDIRNG